MRQSWEQQHFSILSKQLLGVTIKLIKITASILNINISIFFWIGITKVKLQYRMQALAPNNKDTFLPIWVYSTALSPVWPLSAPVWGKERWWGETAQMHTYPMPPRLMPPRMPPPPRIIPRSNPPRPRPRFSPPPMPRPSPGPPYPPDSGPE